jgi:uncharacterized protein YecT (DUF1311 family)
VADPAETDWLRYAPAIRRLVFTSALFVMLVVGFSVGALARQTPFPPPSQPWVDDTIETTLNSCLKQPARSTTISLEDCYQIAENRYDVAIDVAYRAALKHIDATSAARLRQTQATWLTYRKDVYRLMQAPWSGDRGTIVGSQMAQSEIIAQKARVLEIDLIWPGFAEAEDPLVIGTENVK